MTATEDPQPEEVARRVEALTFAIKALSGTLDISHLSSNELTEQIVKTATKFDDFLSGKS